MTYMAEGAREWKIFDCGRPLRTCLVTVAVGKCELKADLGLTFRVSALSSTSLPKEDKQPATPVDHSPVSIFHKLTWRLPTQRTPCPPVQEIGLVLVLEEPVADGGTPSLTFHARPRMRLLKNRRQVGLNPFRSPTTRQPIFIVDSDAICIHSNLEESTWDHEAGLLH